MRWPWQRDVDDAPRGQAHQVSVSDPVLAEWFGVPSTYAGVAVGETTALGIPALYRAVALIAGTIAALPMKTYRDTGDGERQPLRSFLDDPGGPTGPTPFEWKETVLFHLVLHSNAYLAHVYNVGGGLAALIPVHPSSVQPDPPTRMRPWPLYRARMADGSKRDFTPADMTHIVGPSVNGYRGMSLIQVARQSLATTIAGDRAAANLYGNGFLAGGLVTPTDDDTDEDDAKVIKRTIDERTAGWEHAGELAFINRKLKVDKWSMTAEEAQFLQARQYQVEEVARWTGVPPHLLMQTEKQTSWGTGVAEQNRGLGRFTLLPWTTRIEQRLSRLLARPRFVEFEFAGLERPTPEQEIELLIKQVDAGLLTIDEARKIRNMPPLGDDPTPAEQAAAAEGVPDQEEVPA